MEIVEKAEFSRGKVRIIFESGRNVWLTRDQALEINLAEGTEIDRKKLEEFILLHQYPSALDKAVSMLAMRSRSRMEIERKLNEFHYDPSVVELVCFKLEKEKLLDDRVFSEQWVQSRAKKYGSVRIMQELRMKGIDAETAGEAVEQCTESDQLERAVEQACKKIMSIRGKGENEMFRSVTAFLQRRGYSWQIAKNAYQKARTMLQENNE